MENREKRVTRRQLEKSVKDKQVELKSNLRDAKAISKTASEEARDFQTKSIFGSVKFLHEPLFTPKELMTMNSESTKLWSNPKLKICKKYFMRQIIQTRKIYPQFFQVQRLKPNAPSTKRSL